MAIKVQNITKSFRNEEMERLSILQNISFQIENQEFVSFVGPSGCGKSTLLRIIAGFLNADEGAVEIDGKKIEGPGKDRLMVFQDYVLFPWKSVWNNIALGLKLGKNNKEYIHNKVAWAIEMVGLNGNLNSGAALMDNTSSFNVDAGVAKIRVPYGVYTG